MPSACGLVFSFCLGVSFLWDPGFWEFAAQSRATADRTAWRQRQTQEPGSRLSDRWSFLSYFGMPSYTKWARVYKKLSHNTGRQLLLVCRLNST